MKIKYFLLLFCFSSIVLSCSPQNSGLGEDTIENMATSDKVQTMFSEGRKQVVLQSDKAGQQILQNNLIEQESIINNPILRDDFLRLTMDTNALLTQDEEGLKRLMQQMIDVMQVIHKDKDKNNKFVENSIVSRKNALTGDKKLQTIILTQNVNEEELRIHHPSTSQKVKELSLDLNKAILQDPDSNKRLMQQNVILFEHIVEDPVLRSKMADAMLIIMKDPTIQSEMKVMITQAVKMAMEKFKQEMTQEMKSELVQMEQKIKILQQQLEKTNTDSLSEQ